VRRDHRPYWLLRANEAVSRIYADHYIVPQLDSVGPGCKFINPRYFYVNGPRISIGQNLHAMATRERPISLTVYPSPAGAGRISVGAYCIMLPGTRLAAATSIEVGDNCMFAANCSLSDADWHDMYDRTSAPGKTASIRLENNVWIGDSALVCKGVRVGENSIVGAGSVVTKDVPANSVVAGNPARVVKELDISQGFRTREALFAGGEAYAEFIEKYDRFMLAGNSLGRYLRAWLWPGRGD
jgi:acetyltransferase-like isoleucine patch superfamily enzyme